MDRIKKRKLSFAAAIFLSVVMLATSAFAEIAMRSAYEQFKDSIKTTAENMSQEYTSYTINTVTNIKDNGKLVAVMKNSQKVDITGGKRETSSSVSNTIEFISQSYNYSDPETQIWYDSYRDTYNISRQLSGSINKDGYNYRQSNPFEEQQAKDIERIVDALVGNLKDNVNIDINSDGSKLIYGSLTEMQIPPLVNAVMSMIFKQAQPGTRYQVENGTRYDAVAEISATDSKAAEYASTKETKPEINIPVMVDDLYIKSVSGRSEINTEGVITKINATGTISGMDKDGVSHALELELALEITGINSTVLAPPDLTGKKVEENNYTKEQELYSITERFIGTYVNNIIEIRDGKYVKIGERVIKIAHIDEKSVAGNYKKMYYNSADGTNEDFTFDVLKEGGTAIALTYQDSKGNMVKANITFDMNSPELYFNTDYVPDQPYKKPAIGNDSRFTMVFDR